MDLWKQCHICIFAIFASFPVCGLGRPTSCLVIGRLADRCIHSLDVGDQIARNVRMISLHFLCGPAIPPLRIHKVLELKILPVVLKVSWQDVCTNLYKPSLLKRTSLSRSLHKISLILKTSTVPQRELCDMPKVPKGLHQQCQGREPDDMPKLTRGLRSGSQNSHRATRSRCAESDERVARTHDRFSQNSARTTKNED
jgi:hypothetical protein